MLIRRRTFLVLGTAPLCATLPLQSWAGDLYSDYINSTSKQPFVAFLGRQGSTSTVGHAFVGVGVRLDASLIVYEKLFGLYPKDGALAAIKSVFGPTSGKLDKTWDDLSWDTELIHRLDDSQKAGVLSQFKKWTSSAPAYSLVANGGINCNGLVSDVARSLGMKVPENPGTTRPWIFIEGLKLANPD